MKKERAILGRKINFNLDPLPFPFHNVNPLFNNVAGISTPHIIPSLLRAVLSFVAETEPICFLGTEKEKYYHNHFAMGFKSTDNGLEECYVEYHNSDSDPDFCYLTVYNPATGSVHASKYKLSVQKSEKVVVIPAHTEYDGTALWIAMIPTLLDDPVIGPNLYDLVDALKAITYSNSCDTPYMQDLYEDKVRDFMSLMEYEFVSNTSPRIQLVHDTDGLLLISKNNILNKKFAPTKRHLGDFICFANPLDMESGPVNNSKVAVFNPDDYILPFTKQTLTTEEMALIPEIPADNVVSEEAIDLLNEMKETWNNPRATKITQAFFEGGAGSGKSHMARFIAAVLKRPFVTFTCSPNTDEADIKGSLLPVVNTDEVTSLTKKEKELLDIMYKTEGEEMYNALASALGLPSTAECFFDPEGAYEQITGEEKATCDSQEAYSCLCQRVMEVIKELVEKAGKVSKGEVKYKYIPSNIVRAIKNGWFLELQEPSCMLQQGMLACLFDALDKDSIGIINTPCGDIKRHEDFMIIATTNRKYRGTKPLNEAARSRFQYFLKLETPSIEVIAQRLMAKVGLTDISEAIKIAELYKDLEAKVEELNAGAITLRGAYAFADAIKRGKTIKWAAARYLIWPSTTDEDEADELMLAIEDSRLVTDAK